MAVLLTLADAVRALKEGRVIIFPTETYYGLGCNAFDPDAVGKIFAIKSRPMNTPLPVVIGKREDLALLSLDVCPTAAKLMDHFWPGPLSIVLPALPTVPDLLTANAGRVAVRLSPHEATQALCRAAGMVLVASSANLSGDPPVSDMTALPEKLVSSVAGIYQQGPCPSGRSPSTVVDVTLGPGGPEVRILRPGIITAESLQNAGFTVQVQEHD